MNWFRQYFVLPNCCVAFNAKVASSALASSIVNNHYPHLLRKAKEDYEMTWSQFSDEFKNALPDSFQKMFAEDWNSSKSFYQNVCPKTKEPDRPVYLLVREPVDRFVCTVAYLHLDTDDTLTALEKKELRVIDKLPCKVYRNTHFLPQHIYNDGNTVAFAYPSGLQAMCKAAGLDWPLPRINTGKHEKPKLSEEQTERVKKIYADDVALFESLTASSSQGSENCP